MKVLLSKITQPVLTNGLIWKTEHGRTSVSEHSYIYSNCYGTNSYLQKERGKWKDRKVMGRTHLDPTILVFKISWSSLIFASEFYPSLIQIFCVL